MSTMFNTKELTFGSDPETFAAYRNGSNWYVEPPVEFRLVKKVDYTPDPKHPVFIEKDGIVVMEDGVAFEYTLPPTSNAHDLFMEVRQANDMLDEWLFKHGKYTRKTIPAINFDTRRFANKNEEYRMCLIFGCDPDRDAIEPDYVCEIRDVMQHRYRYGGGHIQIGSYNPKIVEFLHAYYVPMVRLMACFVGCVAIKRSRDLFLERQRSIHYGRPGRYRIQDWGLEYRTPSNSWTDNEASLTEMISGLQRSFELLQDPNRGRALLNDLLPIAIKAIAGADQGLASTVVDMAWEY